MQRLRSPARGRWTGGCRPSIPSTKPTRSRRRAHPTRAAPPGRRAGRWTAFRSALKDVISVAGPAAHRLEPHAREFRLALRRDGDAQAEGGRRDLLGPAQSRRIRDGFVHREFRHSRHLQSLGSRARARRLLRRQRRGGGRGRGRRRRSAPTPAARSASPPRSAASSGSSPPTAWSRATA